MAVETKIYLKSGSVLTFLFEKITIETSAATGEIKTMSWVNDPNEPRKLLDIQLDQVAAITTEQRT